MHFFFSPSWIPSFLPSPTLYPNGLTVGLGGFGFVFGWLGVLGGGGWWRVRGGWGWGFLGGGVCLGLGCVVFWALGWGGGGGGVGWCVFCGGLARIVRQARNSGGQESRPTSLLVSPSPTRLSRPVIPPSLFSFSSPFFCIDSERPYGRRPEECFRDTFLFGPYLTDAFSDFRLILFSLVDLYAFS